ncbi:MAG TPA: tetratricopeptide repeat protein [Terracidiphilus sp.]|jgi:tetratricopeptide (TPR) repeat protein|nr:tetratricopeptide repeat protein [Terracidiphilus sp.]
MISDHPRALAKGRRISFSLWPQVQFRVTRHGLQSPPGNPLAWLTLCFRSALLVGAIVSTSAAGQTGGDDGLAQAMQQGSQAMAAGDFNGAVSSYTTVTKSKPGWAEGHFNLGLALQQAGKLDAARTELETAVRLKPELRGANLFLGVIAYKQNRFKDAERNLQRETHLDPANAKAYMWLGICRLAEDDAQGAIAPLDSAYKLDPTDADVLYHRGRAYLLVANASYGAMFKLDHDSMRVHQVLGEAYAQAYRTQEAISEFELAVKMAPRQPGLHEELGDQYWVAGQYDKAGPAYREELAIDSFAVSARYKLGSLLVLNQQPAEGVELLHQVAQQDPTLSDAHYYLGTGLMGLNHDQDAIHEFELAIAADPKDDRAMTSYYKLALIYRKLHQTTEAQTAMQNFMQLRALTKERQDNHTTQIARKRMALPVEDPEKIAMSSTDGGKENY